MRYLFTLMLLAFLAAVPLRAQQETGQQKTSAPTTTEQTADDEEDLDMQIATDWSKLQSHWTMVESATGSAKTEHLEMHRTMLADFMKKFEDHANLEIGREHPDEETKELEGSLAKVQKHWQVVQGIKDPEQLETHLGMHMDLLAGVLAEDEQAGEDEGMGHEGMKHEGMEHGDMDHPKAGEGQPDQKKPAGY
jgi:hypothetical protein